MTVFILKPCEIQHNAAKLRVGIGDFLELPDAKASKLINFGYGRHAVTDDYRKAIADFNRSSTKGATWEQIKRKNPVAWKRHIQALIANDISAARLAYKDLLATAP